MVAMTSMAVFGYPVERGGIRSSSGAGSLEEADQPVCLEHRPFDPIERSDLPLAPLRPSALRG
jgi:hypothetical protein